MNAKKFYDWQTAGGVNDVMALVDGLEKADIPWCAIGGVAVNHWAAEPVVTQDFDLVIAVDDVDQVVHLLEEAGFSSSRFTLSINLKARANVSIQISTGEPCQAFPARSVPADVHGILLRVAALEDTLTGKIMAWRDPERRQSKRIKDLGDIARLVEAHPELWHTLPGDLQTEIEPPA